MVKVIFFEGVTKTRELPEDVKEAFKQGNTSNMFIRPNGCGYCASLSFYKLYPRNGCGEYYIDKDEIDNLKNNFGEYVVVIKDQKELLRRIDNTINSINLIKKSNLKYLCKSITHSDDGLGLDELFNKEVVNKDIAQRGLFTKREYYRYQNEYRIALYTGRKTTEAYILDIGNIKDICVVSDVNHLQDNLSKISKPEDIVSIDEYGNTSIEELTRLLIDMDEQTDIGAFVLY